MIILNKLFGFFRSSKLALVLLILILISCFVGVTLLPAPVSRVVIFSSLWFNLLLVLLVLNIVFCFFGRIWRRKINLISFGLIIFHLSFILLFTGIVYDSLFFFRGSIRLTEGEALSIAEPQSYDRAQWGRFFNHEAKLKGQIYFHKLHPFFKVNGATKGVANEISIGDEINREKTSFIYVTHPLKHKGFRYYCDKDGFSLLFILWDREGRELYGAYFPLQSIKQKDKTYRYTSGTAKGPGSFNFPQDPQLSPVFRLQTTYYPDPKKERDGEVFFQVWQPSHRPTTGGEKELFKGKAVLGERVKVGDYFLSMKEVRYWSSMDVYYNPGLLLILTSLWIGLGGIALTTIARLARKKD